jgi:adenylate kinase
MSIEDQEVIQRLSGRRFHPPSGRTYHVVYEPPKIANQDDITGEALVQREDDNIQIIQRRLAIYHKETLPLVHYYQSGLSNAPHYACIQAHHKIDVVKQQIFSILDQKPITKGV